MSQRVQSSLPKFDGFLRTLYIKMNYKALEKNVEKVFQKIYEVLLTVVGRL